MVKVVVDNINKERVNKVNQTKKELEKIDKELEKLDNKKKKIFEAYEDEIITKEEFLDRREELNDRIKILGREKIPLVTTLSDDVNEKILYEFIRNIL